MTDQPDAVTPSHPPDRILRMVNPFLKSLLRTPLAGSARQQLMVLTFKGRKSGREYSTPVSAHRIDNQLFALGDAPWTKNFRDGAPAEVLHDGKTMSMQGELITDPTTVADLSHRAAESYGARKAQRMMGLSFRDDGVPSLQDFRHAVEKYKLVAVRLTPVG